MKTKNTLENKMKFFALYWGQEVLFATDERYNTSYSYGTIGNKIYNDTYFIKYYLLLKPLSTVTLYEYENSFPSYYDTDILRSKGYALPYLDLSVEDLISYGWIKLEE